MPRHSFLFPREVVIAIKNHVNLAISKIDPRRFRQEPTYTAALVSHLEGVAYDGPHGKVTFKATVMDDHGPKTAEARVGADFAITATITNAQQTVEKAILVQAKMGRIGDMSQERRDELDKQIRKMKKVVRAPKVMEIIEQGGKRMPAMVSGNKVVAGEAYQSTPLADYFTSRVTTTLDGCTDPITVTALQESTLSQIHVDATING